MSLSIPTHADSLRPALRAGLSLYFDCWEEAHAVAQGVNTPEGSYWHAIVHRRWLPVRDPQQLVQLKLHAARTAPPGERFSYAIVTALADQKEIFSDVCGFSAPSFSVGPRGSVSRVPGAWVTGDYYETLGLSPALGRLLTRADPGCR